VVKVFLVMGLTQMVQRLDGDITEVNFANSFDGECSPKGALTADGLLKDATVAYSKGGCV
jgi:hypothetical protein